MIARRAVCFVDVFLYFLFLFLMGDLRVISETTDRLSTKFSGLTELWKGLINLVCVTRVTRRIHSRHVALQRILKSIPIS